MMVVTAADVGRRVVYMKDSKEARGRGTITKLDSNKFVWVLFDGFDANLRVMIACLTWGTKRA